MTGRQLCHDSGQPCRNRNGGAAGSPASATWIDDPPAATVRCRNCVSSAMTALCRYPPTLGRLGAGLPGRPAPREAGKESPEKSAAAA